MEHKIILEEAVTEVLQIVPVICIICFKSKM